MGYLMGPVIYEGVTNKPQPAAPAPRDEDTRALREAWGRNSAARARAQGWLHTRVPRWRTCSERGKEQIPRRRCLQRPGTA